MLGKRHACIVTNCSIYCQLFDTSLSLFDTSPMNVVKTKTMKKKFVSIVTTLFLTVWALLLFHSHPAHSGDLHPSHSPCQICSHSNFLSQKTISIQSFEFSLFSQNLESIQNVLEISAFCTFTSSRNSRAPPLSLSKIKSA